MLKKILKSALFLFMVSGMFFNQPELTNGKTNTISSIETDKKNIIKDMQQYIDKSLIPTLRKAGIKNVKTKISVNKIKGDLALVEIDCFPAMCPVLVAQKKNETWTVVDEVEHILDVCKYSSLATEEEIKQSREDKRDGTDMDICGRKITKKNFIISKKDIKTKALNIINNNLIRDKKKIATIKDVVEEKFVYKIRVVLYDSREGDSYFSKDGDLFFQDGKNVDVFKNKKGLNAKETKKLIVDFINKNYAVANEKVLISDVTEGKNLFKINKLMDGYYSTSIFYLTKDGKKFFPKVFEARNAAVKYGVRK